jgi:hypothetical protein
VYIEALKKPNVVKALRTALMGGRFQPPEAMSTNTAQHKEYIRLENEGLVNMFAAKMDRAVSEKSANDLGLLMMGDIEAYDLKVENWFGGLAGASDAHHGGLVGYLQRVTSMERSTSKGDKHRWIVHCTDNYNKDSSTLVELRLTRRQLNPTKHCFHFQQEYYTPADSSKTKPRLPGPWFGPKEGPLTVGCVLVEGRRSKRAMDLFDVCPFVLWSHQNNPVEASVVFRRLMTRKWVNRFFEKDQDKKDTGDEDKMFALPDVINEVVVSYMEPSRPKPDPCALPSKDPAYLITTKSTRLPATFQPTLPCS